MLALAVYSLFSLISLSFLYTKEEKRVTFIKETVSCPVDFLYVLVDGREQAESIKHVFLEARTPYLFVNENIKINDPSTLVLDFRGFPATPLSLSALFVYTRYVDYRNVVYEYERQMNKHMRLSDKEFMNNLENFIPEEYYYASIAPLLIPTIMPLVSTIKRRVRSAL